MASDYDAIRQSNRTEYGSGVGRWGKEVLAVRYDDRTHFIFELLQNAEDALARREGWKGSRAIKFHLSEHALRISHYGKPFDERDVHGVCGIAESTKDLTAIGRFGIGFKSVYAFTARPEIHSGGEDFSIDSFVLPTATSAVERDDDETVILLPLNNEADRHEIALSLQRLGARTLLFLRRIEEIEWQVENGPSGVYIRGESKNFAEGVRRVTVIGQVLGQSEIEEHWLIFSRPVTADDIRVGHVEIGCLLVRDKASGSEVIESLAESPLVAYFPTALSTHLGFLIQGPYRTTPSRDNVPRNEPWNQYLVRETAALLGEMLRWLRDQERLDTVTLHCLPIDRSRFGEANMFAPLFEAARQALKAENLLPTFGGGYASANISRLARTKELRELLTPTQLGTLFGNNGQLRWLSSEITADRTPQLRQYLVRELSIQEITPEMIVQRLGKPFLEAQSNEWTLLLYEFLNGQPSLLKQSRLVDLPLVRLEDGTHVTPMSSGQPQAFLPGIVETSFPTVAPSVCSTDESRAFLKSLGLQEPDAVADVIRNILPRYRAQNADIAEVSYASDIQRILSAFATDSKSQRDKLVMALRGIPFIKAVDMGDSTRSLAKPEDVYLSTDRLKELFADVGGVRIVDDSIACLRGEDVRELLEACGATRYLRPIFTSTFFTAEERTKMRIAAGYESMSSQDPILDNALRGLDQLLSQLPKFDFDTRQKRSTLLWEALGELEERRGAGIFSGTYCWFYMRQRSTTFDAAFLRQLNDSAWVPTRTGVLERPSYVKFDSLNWKVNPYLQSKIRFKPPIIDSLAIEAGFEPSMLDLLKKLGVTSEAELRLKLGISLEESSHGKPATQSAQQTPSNHSDSSFNAAHPVVNQNSGETHDAGVRPQSELDANAPVDDGAESSKAGKQPGASGYDIGKQEPGSFGSKPFISYVRVAPDEDDHDPDGLGQAARMALEEKAIALILKQEPILQRTPTNNPGFDLFETSADDKTVRWVEVKSMTGGFQDRPVGLSRTQFDLARKCGVAYWLYVVEHTGTERPRVIRIQDPSGKAQTFTFDHGWLEVASKNDNWDRPAG